MKTKKQLINRILSLMLSLVMVLGLLPTRIISASATGDHTHQFEGVFWDFDSNGHWHRCIEEDCEITDYSATNEVGTAYGAHADADTDGICDICDYHITHEHTGWTELTADVLVAKSYTLGDGKYYLTDNLDTIRTICIDGNVSLCLSGKTIKANASMSNPYQVIEIKADSLLDLYDCSETHAGRITGGSARNGSGVIGYGTFRMFGGTITENNKDRTTKDDSNGDGAAVWVNTEFIMYGGRIYNNNAVYGGGVASYYSKNTFNMSGGKIYGNKADTVGGVYVGSKGLFDISGGEITNNIATGEIGGGVFIDSDSVSFTLSGRPVISENKKGDYNTDIVLVGDKKITINDELTTDSPIGVMLLSDNLPATGDFTKNWSTHMSTADCNVHFFSNDDNYGVKLSENGEELELYALPEHRDWIYSKTGNVITATCGISGCAQSGGNVTLNVSDAYYTGNAIGGTVQGSFTNGATYKITYDNGSETAPSSVGTHTVKLTVLENGTEKQSLTLQYKIDYLPASENAYTISNAETKIGDIYWFKKQPVTVLASEGYTIGSGLDGSYGTSIEYYEGDDFVFYLKRQSDGAMTDGIDFSQQIRFDSTAPIGKIAVDERNFGEALINKITFGWFFKGDKTAHITATDIGSGIKNIEYFVSDRDLIADKTLSHMDAAIRLEAAVGNHWATYNNDIALNNNSKNVIYAKITDNVGNISYISSEGIVLDATVPVIEGIENGKTYYTTQRFTVKESNLESVTVNGNPSMTFALGGNVDKEYVIVATDKAGNATTVTVTMKPIKVLAKATENLGNDNVTSADAPVLKELVEKLDELIADPDTSDDGERETLQQHKVIAESLLKTIEDAAKAVDTENTEKVKGVTAENVTAEDKTDLEKAKVDLEKALEVSGGNYTEDEKKSIRDEIKRIEAALAELNKPVTDSDTPQTGDNTNLWLWVVLLFVSSTGIFGITLYDRKRRTASKK